MRALRILDSRSLHVMIDHTDQIVDVGSGDSEMYEASCNLSEPFLVAGNSGVWTSLPIPIKGC